MTQIEFNAMGLTPELERAIENMGFTTPTPVQEQAIFPLLESRDVLARSQTGTGKTMAFAIPAIERIDPDLPYVQVLVLCPTRELAMQAADEFRKLARYMPHIHPVEIYGGAPIDKQCILLRKANIVIGTPGRVMDHMRRKTLRLQELRMLILDEADEMLDMGFKEDIETILQDVPETRQTAMFSATMPPAILSLTRNYQHDPLIIEINKDEATIRDIAQTYLEVPRQQKIAALTVLLEYHRPTRTIIFCNTKKMVDEITEALTARGFAAMGLHSDVKQSQRTAIMYNFKRGKTAILAATDIAARGIDVNDVDFVINYDVPQNMEYYIHRIGRTGRAGKSGCSITICGTRGESAFMRRIAFQTKSELKQVDLPTVSAIESARGTELASHIEESIAAETPVMFDQVVAELMEKGYTAEQIAKAALTRFCSEQYAALPEIPKAMQEPRRERTNTAKRFDPTKRDRVYAVMVIDIGSDRGVWKNHLLGAITERTGLSGNDIGKIDVYPERSKVEVPADSMDETISSMQGCTVCGKRVHAEKYSDSQSRRPRERDGKRNDRMRSQDAVPFRKRNTRREMEK